MRNPFTLLWRKYLLVPAGHGHPIPAAAAAADAAYANGSWAHFDGPGEQERYLLLAGRIGRLHPAASVLDLGCGPGRLAQLLQSHAPRRCLGVDFSPEAVRRARELGLAQCEFVTADFEHWRPEERFDAIVLNEAGGYARDPGALVRAFLPFLETGGHFFISYFRSAHWPAVWHRIESHLTAVEASTIRNDLGQTWDVKILRPRRPA